MNRFELPRNAGEARLRYGDNDYQVIAVGSFVRCAVTGEAIALDDLKYWSVDKQEAYVSADASIQAYQRDRD